MVYVVQLASRIGTNTVPSWCCSQAVSKPVWHIPLLFVPWRTADDGQRNCPKHVEFHSKNKFEKLVILVGFIIRIYHDARSLERNFFFLLSKSPSYTCVTKDWLTYFVLCGSDFQDLKIRQVESIKFYNILFFSYVAAALSAPGPPHCLYFHIAMRHKQPVALLDERSARRTGRYPHNTQPTQDTNIHPLSGDLTAVNLCLGPTSHRDRHLILLIQTFWESVLLFFSAWIYFLFKNLLKGISIY